jgi:hypothetical protein
MALAGNLVRASDDAGRVRNTATGSLVTLGGQAGCLDVTHNAGFTPSQVLVTAISPSGGGHIFTSANVILKDATTFRIRAFGFGAGVPEVVPNGTSVTFDWVAYP